MTESTHKSRSEHRQREKDLLEKKHSNHSHRKDDTFNKTQAKNLSDEATSEKSSGNSTSQPTKKADKKNIRETDPKTPKDSTKTTKNSDDSQGGSEAFVKRYKGVFTNKNKDSDSSSDESSQEEDRVLDKRSEGGKKTAPTPKRKDQEAQQKRPLVASTSQMTKEEKADLKAKERTARQEEREKQDQAFKSGDPKMEKYFPAKDQGDQARYVRDIVDGQKFDLAQYSMIIIIILIIPALIAQDQTIQTIVLVVFYLFLFYVIISRFFLAQKIKKAIQEKFGSIEKGKVWYGLMRSISLRRFRLPKPAVSPGEEPRSVSKTKAKASSKKSK